VYTTQEIGELIRQTRIGLNMSQEDLAMTVGARARFISDLENGKPTCQFGKVLSTLQMLGIQLVLQKPQSGGTDTRRRVHRVTHR
jgi:HTH-type transcriptional regulator / antitoxin HipB